MKKIDLASQGFLLITCTTIFLLSVFLRSIMDIGGDTGLYINIGQKISEGKKYYFDFFEGNFPISFYFYALQYKLAKIFAINPVILSEIIINFCALGAIFWSSKILQKSAMQKSHQSLIVIAYFLGFFLRIGSLQIGEFGTKTSLFLIIFFPYLSYSFFRHTEFTKKDLLLRGLLIGLIPCLKPHYLIPIIAIEITRFCLLSTNTKNKILSLSLQNAAINGNPCPTKIAINSPMSSQHGCGIFAFFKFIFALDKLFALAIGMFYLLLMMKFTPEFFEYIIPLWLKLYKFYDNTNLFFFSFISRIADCIVYIFILLAFTRIKPSFDDKILISLFISTIFLIALENVGTFDQLAFFYAITTICFVKIFYDLIATKSLPFNSNKFISFSILIIPIFNLDLLPSAIFSIGGITNIWWIMAIVYPFILQKKLQLKSSQIINFFLFFILLLVAMSWIIIIKENFVAMIVLNLVAMFFVIVYFENLHKKISHQFASFSFFIIISSASCLFYSYISSITKVGNSSSPNQYYQALDYYGKEYANQKSDKILVFSNIINSYFPLPNYTNRQHDFVMAIAPVTIGIGNFPIKDFDSIYLKNYITEKINDELRDRNTKLLIFNNDLEVTKSMQDCSITLLEDYIANPKFRKLFFENFTFENRVIISDPKTKKIKYDFEVYKRKN